MKSQRIQRFSMIKQCLSAAALALASTAAQAQLPLPLLGDVIADRYIVTLKNAAALQRLSELPISLDAIDYRYDAAFPGFAARLPAHVAKRLEEHGLVASVEPDRVMRLVDTQVNPPWGLDRIDMPAPQYDSRYNYRLAGQGVHAYVIDSGLRASHRDFTGRVGNGFDTQTTSGGLLGGGGLFGSRQPSNPPKTDPLDPSSTPPDCNGHGTHVAGTIGGTTFGVAKRTILHGVRVVNCQGVGNSSATVAGIDWVIKNHVKPAVINLSLGGSASSAVDAAVKSAHDAGIVVVVAAGNETADACRSSPARAPQAITVAATERDDRRASYSNFGPCIDLFAPGSGVLSAGNRSDTDQAVMSGTSMASPHVAGAAAKLLAEGVTAANVTSVLLNRATRGVILDGRNSVNALLFSD